MLKIQQVHPVSKVRNFLDEFSIRLLLVFPILSGLVRCVSIFREQDATLVCIAWQVKGEKSVHRNGKET